MGCDVGKKKFFGKENEKVSRVVKENPAEHSLVDLDVRAKGQK